MPVSFLIKLSTISVTSLKTRLYHRCFLVKFSKFLTVFVLQNTAQRLLLIIAVSIVMKGEVANKTVNYVAKAKAYVPI